jgi:hypothetical protein
VGLADRQVTRFVIVQTAGESHRTPDADNSENVPPRDTTVRRRLPRATSALLLLAPARSSSSRSSD